MASIISDSVLNKNTDVSGYNNLTKFNGYFDNRYLDGLESGVGFVFITKPQLFITPYKSKGTSSAPNSALAYENMCKDPFFTLFINGEALNDLDKEIVKQLSYDLSLSESYFLKIFTNSIKNFDPSDITLESQDAYDTKQGYRELLPTHTTASQAAGTLSFNITETKNMDITKMLSLWVKYIENVTDGTFYANPNMVAQGSLDYTCSIYYFFLGPDGHSIKYWCKYTGCYPTNVPYSPYKYSKGDRNLIELDVQFNYTIKEDMSPRIFEDFNRVSLKVSDYDTMSDSFLLDYAPISESSLLDYNKLVSGSMSNTVNSTRRDPLVFLNKRSNDTSILSDSMSDRFELSFSTNDMNYIFAKERFNSNYNYISGYETKLESGE